MGFSIASTFFFSTSFIERQTFSLLYSIRKGSDCMKIEKINENQIRCTLTRADLAERQLQLSELAYGTEKARSLFHDMMQQAAFEFGFEADNMPLMIEAIPSSADSIVLIITKVEDPEELDARFSKFAPSPEGTSNPPKSESINKLEGAETLLNLLDKVKEKINAAEHDKKTVKEEPAKPPTSSLRLFSFATMDDVLEAVHFLSTMYSGSNTLYKDHAADIFILALTQSEYSTQDFNRICNMLTEYGTSEKASGMALAFLEEHCEALVPQNAVQLLSTI